MITIYNQSTLKEIILKIVSWPHPISWKALRAKMEVFWKRRNLSSRLYTASFHRLVSLLDSPIDFGFTSPYNCLSQFF